MDRKLASSIFKLSLWSKRWLHAVMATEQRRRWSWIRSPVSIDVCLYQGTKVPSKIKPTSPTAVTCLCEAILQPPRDSISYSENVNITSSVYMLPSPPAYFHSGVVLFGQGNFGNAFSMLLEFARRKIRKSIWLSCWNSADVNNIISWVNTMGRNVEKLYISALGCCVLSSVR